MASLVEGRTDAAKDTIFTKRVRTRLTCRGIANAAQLRMHARVEGEGFPILIIHGWLMRGDVEAADFEPIFTARGGFRRIYVDLPGMGSSPPDGIRSLDDILDRLNHFVEEMILPSKFVVIGCSCGAYLARAVAYRFRDHVEGLLLRIPLVESGPRDIDPFKPLIANPELMASLSKKDRKILGDVEIQTPTYIETLKTQLTSLILPALAASSEHLLNPIRDDPETYTIHRPKHTKSEQFTKPTLIMTGRSDTVVGYRDAWSLMDVYPRATYVTLDRGRHGSPVSDVELFNALVRDWLNRVEENLANMAP